MSILPPGNLYIVATRKGEVVQGKLFTDISQAKFALDGPVVDTIHLTAVLQSPAEIDALITMLQVSRQAMLLNGVQPD